MHGGCSTRSAEWKTASQQCFQAVAPRGGPFPALSEGSGTLHVGRGGWTPRPRLFSLEFHLCCRPWRARVEFIEGTGYFLVGLSFLPDLTGQPCVTAYSLDDTEVSSGPSSRAHTAPLKPSSVQN